MIQLPVHIKPDQPVIDALADYQGEVNVAGSFTQRSTKAKNCFSKKNKKSNKVFDAVKNKLTEMCSGARRCVYCEDSVGDEVEHIHPKDLYPGQCFDWNNYVYACGNCNGPKNNKFAVFRNSDGLFFPVNPPRGLPAIEPPPGDDAMINPRIENAMDYCMLDLKSTFQFVITEEAGSKKHQKADYTFNEVLRLNQREFLRVAREEAFRNYKARLYEYTHQKAGGTPRGTLNAMISAIQKAAHPTVWKEMQRQHKERILIKIAKDLDDLFIQSPEALNW